ncbi:MAG: tRNA (N(6)-L-threonylcarbamoyladenosine(37)-C(2))-methylthiotransferase MtaB [Turicibacter sp.]|nr:tRNA (N(6)-L-threonylcarbamoyladenosine(37)-C(2))-methylthiotransferase MtaB [Turicibacter sp.]
MPTVAFHTLGCKVNHYETEAVWELFKKEGYEKIDFKEAADVYVINTCTVTNTGDKKSRQTIRRAIRKNPEAVMCVMGCYAQTKPKEIMDIEGVDIVIGTHGRDTIPQLVQKYQEERQPISHIHNVFKVDGYETLHVNQFENRKRATLKIQEGCNNFCTFCIIPWARGTIRSEDPKIVLEQVKNLVANGHHEVVLTGIHTAGYGADLEDYSFGKLLKDLIKVEGLKRIRISSIEISQVDEDVIEAMKMSDKIVNHLHMPIQAGSDPILKAMKRHYTIEQYEAKIKELREVFEDLAITTDIIVGFPGETEEMFASTVDALTRIGFSELHVFPYSVRNGTPAAKMDNQVPEVVKSMRVNQLIALSEQLAKGYASTQEGKTLHVIVEESKDGYLMGHAGNYVKVKFKGDDSLIGEMVAVKIEKAGYPVCEGEVA